MSIQGHYQGGVERPEMTRLTTASATTVKTAQDGQLVIGSIGLANETSTATIVSLHYSREATDFLFWRGTVPGDETVIINNHPIRLYDTDVLKATAAVADRITVFPNAVTSNPHERAG